MDGFLLDPFFPPLAWEHPFEPGDLLLRRFRIVREVDEGGMGIVYEAVDERLEKRIALKCAKPGFGRRLPPEVRNAREIAHPNVCKIFEIHTASTERGDIDFLTMEFLDGETLATRLAREPMDVKEARSIAHQLCDGLAEAHRKQVIHGDLKSANVILTPGLDGTVRAAITDFGLARGLGVAQRTAQSGEAGGTPDYMAPELWKGVKASVASDIYALGVILYELASGHHPFPKGTGWDERRQSLPSAPDAPEPLRSAVLRCLDPDPTKRFRNVDELKHALRVGLSRRWLLYGAIGLAASGLAGAFLKEQVWPTSAVRLAMLPPLITDVDTDAAPLINGFLHDLSYRLKTLRGVRRPWGVFSFAQTAPQGVKTAAAARRLFGATHAITSSFRPDQAGLLISAELIETATGRSLHHWNRVATRADLSDQLYAMQSNVVEDTVRQLSLRSEPRLQTLTRESYADYLQGLYYVRSDFQNAPKAIPYFEKVISAAPNSALAYAGLAEALLGARYALSDKSLEGKAITALAKADQLDPEVAHVRLISGRLNNAGGLYERALADFRRAAELAPNDAEPFIGMAISLYMLNRLPEAEAALRSGIAAEPSNYRPYLDLGQFFYEQRNFPQAERYWLEAVRLGPGQSQARLNLADLFIVTDRMSDAETQILDSLKISRTQGALKTLGLLQEQSGRYTDAIASYEEAIRTGPQTYMIWSRLGVACRRAGRDADAVRAFRSGLENTEEGIRTYPREAERVAWCAYYHANLGELQQARARATQALGMASPPLVSVRKLLVLAYDLIHDKDAALRLLEGAPPGLLKELTRSAEISDALRRDPRLNN
jgi:serine/threonine-protein kinase